MKVIIALFAVALAMVAAEPSYVSSVVPQAVPVPVSTSVWPSYGVYGKGLARYAPVAGYAGYPGVYGGGLPVYDNAWGYSAPVVGAYGAVSKVVDNGLWNYGGYGYGHTNKYWL